MKDALDLDGPSFCHDPRQYVEALIPVPRPRSFVVKKALKNASQLLRGNSLPVSWTMDLDKTPLILLRKTLSIANRNPGLGTGTSMPLSIRLRMILRLKISTAEPSIQIFRPDNRS